MRLPLLKMLKPSCANIRPTGAPYGAYLHIDYRSALRRLMCCAVRRRDPLIRCHFRSPDADVSNRRCVSEPRCYFNTVCFFFFFSPPVWLLRNETRRFRSCCRDAGVQTVNRGSSAVSFLTETQNKTKQSCVFFFFFPEQKSTKPETSLFFCNFSMWKNC